MTGDPIQRLRDADPVRDGGNAPAFEHVQAWVRQEQGSGASRGSRRRPAWVSLFVPALGLAATLGVITVVIVAVAHHPRPRTDVRPATMTVTPAVPSPVSLLRGRGGMRGLVYATTVVGSGATLHASFVQCTNCTGDTTPPHAHQIDWSAVSTDGGARWQTRRDRSFLLAFGLALPEGPDVWQAGYTPHPTDPFFYVSHDHGRTFVPARASKNTDSGPVTLGAGEAWTLGVRCIHYRCGSSVLHGAAAGSRLTQTTSQPPGMPVRYAPSTLIVAGYGPRAYVSQKQRRIYATNDNGRDWNRLSYPCATGMSILALTPSSDGSVWVSCASTQRVRTGRATDPRVTIRRSDDSGAHWTTPGPTIHAAGGLVAASPRILWAAGQHGALQRTTDGGRSWQTVLRGAGLDPALDIQSATTATAIATATVGNSKTHNRRTELVAYRTTNGGERWTHNLIHLPTG